MDHYQYRKELQRYVEAYHQFAIRKPDAHDPTIRVGCAHHAQEAANAAQNLADHHSGKDRINTVPGVVWSHLAGRWISTMLEYTELPDVPYDSSHEPAPIPSGGTTP